jgi:hypothetical protein
VPCKNIKIYKNDKELRNTEIHLITFKHKSMINFSKLQAFIRDYRQFEIQTRNCVGGQRAASAVAGTMQQIKTH